MAKITDYPKVTEVANNDTLILDGENGTKGILAEDLARGLVKIDSSTIQTTQTAGKDDTFQIAVQNGESTENKKIKFIDVLQNLPVSDLIPATALRIDDIVTLKTNQGMRSIKILDFVKKMNIGDLTAVENAATNDQVILRKGDENKKLLVGDLFESIYLANAMERTNTLVDTDALMVGKAPATGQTTVANKHILVSDLMTYLTDKITENLPKGNIFDQVDALDPIAAFPLRRALWRGKNFGGSGISAAQNTAISNGSFKGIFLGDYWSPGGAIHRIHDFNYWLNSGDSGTTANHLVLMPDHKMYDQRINASNTTAGGYLGSEMRASGLNNAKSTINSAFGASHILTYRGLFVNAVTNGKPTGGTWADASIELASQIMMYGSAVFGYPLDGSDTLLYLYTIDKQQLAGMQANPVMVNPHRENVWLRDTVSVSYFAAVSNVGYAGNASASGALGVRPVYGIKAA